MQNSIEIYQTTAKADKQGFISIKPLCEAFGLDWSTQLQMIKNDEILTSTMGKFPTVATDGKDREMVHLNKKGFIRWVQLINPKSVKPELKENLIKYQSDVFDYIFGSIDAHQAMNIDYQRTKELELIISKAKEELKTIKFRVDNFLDTNFGQLQLF